MRPAASIVVLFHSGAGLLAACLESLLSTLDAQDEILVVVNSDDVREASVAHFEDRVRYLRMAKGVGYSRAANFGADRAENDLLVFCDHDLVFSPGWLEELWTLYRKDKRLGAVSCCVLNAHTNCVLDFGIAYTRFNGAHPFLDLPYGHPLVEKDIVAQTVCTGGFLIERATFQRVGGFDEAMGSLYSDVDLCLRLKRDGKSVGAAHKAVAHHFGGDTSQIQRTYKSVHLKADVKGYFQAKNADVLDVDLDRYYRMALNHLLTRHAISERYFFCNMMNVVDPGWYEETLREIGLSLYDGVRRPSGKRDAEKEGLYELLGHDLAQIPSPILYLVDRFPAVRGNHVWWRRRGHFHDLVADRNANIQLVDDVLRGTLKGMEN